MESALAGFIRRCEASGETSFGYQVAIEERAALAAAIEEHEKPKPRMFPIQSQRGAAPHPLSIPWEVAELAYSVYSANYGRSQSLARIAERGGFGPGEMDDFLPGWRDKCSRLSAAERVIRELVEAWPSHPTTYQFTAAIGRAEAWLKGAGT